LQSLAADDGDPEEIELEKISVTKRKKFLRDHNIPYDAGFTSLKIPCLLGCCAEGMNPDQKMASFMKKIATCQNRDLMINDNTGLFMCVNCHRQGTWRVLEDVISMLSSSGTSLTSSMTQALLLPGIKSSRPPMEQAAEVLFLYDNAISIQDLTTVEFSKIVYRISQHQNSIESIKRSTFIKFGVKYDPERKCLLFPLTSPEGVTGLKIYNLGNDQNDNKSASDYVNF